MPNKHNEDTQARQERILQCLLRFEDGLKVSEIAEETHIERRTLDNHLKKLQARGDIDKDGMVWYALPNRNRIRPIADLQPEEAFMLYLAARLLVKQQDKRNLIAENVLLKLAHVLQSDLNVDDYIVNAAQELSERPEIQKHDPIFRTLIWAYLLRQPVSIRYETAQGYPVATVIEPYLIEPSAINYAIYVIARDQTQNAIRTYRLQRMTFAEAVEHQNYLIPSDFDGLKLLRSAWSIYYGEATTQVKLRFHPDVARRVQETHWHDSQNEIEFQNGYAILTIQVADTTDLKPWIRTWGHNCEVLEPSELRAEMIGDTRRLADLYGLQLDANRQRYEGIFGD